MRTKHFYIFLCVIFLVRCTFIPFYYQKGYPISSKVELIEANIPSEWIYNVEVLVGKGKDNWKNWLSVGVDCCNYQYYFRDISDSIVLYASYSQIKNSEIGSSFKSSISQYPDINYTSFGKMYKCKNACSDSLYLKLNLYDLRKNEIIHADRYNLYKVVW